MPKFCDDRPEPLHIHVAGSEAFPFAKTGGLGDVLGALPGALERLGHQPTLICRPIVRFISAAARSKKPACGSRCRSGKNVSGGLLRSTLPGDRVPVYCKQDSTSTAKVCMPSGNVGYQDTASGSYFFNRAVLEAIRLLDLPPT